VGFLWIIFLIIEKQIVFLLLLHYVSDVLSTFRADCLFLLAYSYFQTLAVIFDTLFCENVSFIA